MNTCSKCLTECDFVIKYKDDQGEYCLCPFCHRFFDINLLVEFLKEDYGDFPISDIGRYMIDARRKRNLNQSPWKKKDE